MRRVVVNCCNTVEGFVSFFQWGRRIGGEKTTLEKKKMMTVLLYFFDSGRKAWVSAMVDFGPSCWRALDVLSHLVERCFLSDCGGTS